MNQVLTNQADTALVTFEVNKQEIGRTRFAESVCRLQDIGPGQVLLKVDTFAFTANNITYAELGDRLAYWKFFPASAADWGTIPVWGFADVIASNHDSIAVDERLFGFLPMATHLVAQPVKVTDNAFVDGTAHRSELPPAYNHYMRVTSDPDFSPRFEPVQSLLRPLFITSFLIDDFLAEENFFGAGSVILSSASGKTAMGLAHLLHRHGRVKVIGLTSEGNRAFVEGLGIYDLVVTYDRLASLPSEETAVYVDFAGSGELRRAIHEQYGDNLKYSCAVGMSHRQGNPPGKGLPGPKPVFFFAPDRIVKRNKDWGRGGIDMRLGNAWRDFLPAAESWLTIVHGSGRESVEAVYRATLDGRVKPSEGHVLSLWE